MDHERLTMNRILLLICALTYTGMFTPFAQCQVLNFLGEEPTEAGVNGTVDMSSEEETDLSREDILQTRPFMKNAENLKILNENQKIARDNRIIERENIQRIENGEEPLPFVPLTPMLTFTEDEYLEWVKGIEKLNPHADRETIVTKMHSIMYPGDYDLKIAGVPLFREGQDTKNAHTVDIPAKRIVPQTIINNDKTIAHIKVQATDRFIKEEILSVAITQAKRTALLILIFIMALASIMFIAVLKPIKKLTNTVRIITKRNIDEPGN